MVKKIDIKKYADSEAWFNYQVFYDFVSTKKYKTLVEVGVWKGHSISYLANQNKGAQIYAVDLFDKTYRYKKKHLKEQVPYLYEIYNFNLNRFKVRNYIKDIQGYSWECSNQFKDSSIDFVYIDADHRYESVKKDLNAWFKKIKPRGIFSGHDYEPYEGQNHPGVKRAVDEFAIENNLTLKTYEGCVWYFEL